MRREGPGAIIVTTATVDSSSLRTTYGPRHDITASVRNRLTKEWCRDTLSPIEIVKCLFLGLRVPQIP